MGGRDDFGMAQQGIVSRRLLSEHIQGHPGQPIAIQCFQKRRIVDQFAPGHVYEARPRFDDCQLGSANHLVGAIGERGMQGYKVGLGQHLFQSKQFYAQSGGVIWGDERVVANQPHAEALGPSGDFGTYPPQSGDTQCLVANLDAHESATPPLAALDGAMGLGDVPGKSQHQGDGVLGGGDRVARRGVDDGDTGAGGRLKVDVVHADPGPGDDLQLLARADDLRRNLGLAAHDQCVVIPQNLHQFRCG